MKLTSEQIAILHSSGNIKINAVAGSGKTTTIIEYAKTRKEGSRILYIAFNKSVRAEAIKKFQEHGLTSVKVETAHSLAYKNIVHANNYKVRSQGYRTNELAEILHLKISSEKHGEYILANHINKFISYFCNSDKQKVSELNYLDIVADDKARLFVKAHYANILRQVRIFLGMMNDGRIEVTHDFYLKKFQLSNPLLPYDYILFDEGQDASPAILDIFLKQNAIKVIVGDTHQQIYGWRHAVNSLSKVDFKTFHLSSSFRFAQPIAELAMEVLQYKENTPDFLPIAIKGKGQTKTVKSKAIIARSNLGLLLKAIEFVSEMSDKKKIYFEGNFNSYTYADEGASLYDVLNLFFDNKHLIRDPLIGMMRDTEELEEYIDKTEDMQLSMMLEIVREYGMEIPGILKRIKSLQVDNDEKEKATMVFSTVHRAKGMEYDSVQLVGDFITAEKAERQKEQIENKEAKNQEEINLLYVAITRTRNSLYIPEKLIPKDFPAHAQIHILKTETNNKSENKKNTSFGTKFSAPKNEVFHDRKFAYKPDKDNATSSYKTWTVEEDAELIMLFCEGVTLLDMAKHFGRTKSAVGLRIKKLDLENLYGNGSL